jgi:hypothetical protein
MTVPPKTTRYLSVAQLLRAEGVELLGPAGEGHDDAAGSPEFRVNIFPNGEILVTLSGICDLADVHDRCDWIRQVILYGEDRGGFPVGFTRDATEADRRVASFGAPLRNGRCVERGRCAPRPRGLVPIWEPGPRMNLAAPYADLPGRLSAAACRLARSGAPSDTTQKRGRR